jgi:hypothetical protein
VVQLQELYDNIDEYLQSEDVIVEDGALEVRFLIANLCRRAFSEKERIVASLGHCSTDVAALYRSLSNALKTGLVVIPMCLPRHSRWRIFTDMTSSDTTE